MSLTNPNAPRVGFQYIVVCCIAVFLTFFFHELAHWTAGELLGYKMGMRLNIAFPLKEYDPVIWRLMVIVAAGPLFTLIQAVTFYFIMKRSNNPLLFPFLLTPFYMRLLATIISIHKLNDEANISKESGIGAFTIPVIICAVLFYFVFSISKQKKYTLKFILQTFGLVLVYSSAIILADMYFKVRLI